MLEPVSSLRRNGNEPGLGMVGRQYDLFFCGRQLWVFSVSVRVFESFSLHSVLCQAYPFSASFLLSLLGGNFLPGVLCFDITDAPRWLATCISLEGMVVIIQGQFICWLSGFCMRM
jgi:hypothetical protein